MNGLVDEDIKKEILGQQDLDKLSVDDTVTRIESKETARNALSQSTGSAGISSFKKEGATRAAEDKKLSTMIKCGDCDQKINAYVKVKGGQIRPRKYCKDCFNKSHRKQRPFVPGKSAGNDDKEKDSDTTSSLHQIGSIESQQPDVSSFRPGSIIDIASIGSPRFPNRKAVVLDHPIFHPGSETWKKGRSLPQPTVRLRVTTDDRDYEHFGLKKPATAPASTDSVADTGAQSCLMA